MKNKKLAVKLSKILTICVIVVSLGLLSTYYFYRHNGGTFSQTPTKGGASVNTSKGQTSDSATDNTQQSGNAKTDTGNGSATSLIAPSGDFVSNHQPSLSRGIDASSETSVCATTPGATCVITFTQNGITKSLSRQTTDKSGNAYWNWKLRDIGLTPGIWKITATASFGNNSLSASDALELQISQ